MSNTAQEILDAVGGPDNITHFTHCATRLRFELRDASVIDKDTVEAIDGVLGAVPQSGDRYQIVIGGAVQSVFDEINNLPSMKSQGGSSARPVRTTTSRPPPARRHAARTPYVDAFFEYLSDSFRPLLPGAPRRLPDPGVPGGPLTQAFGFVDTRADAADPPHGCGYVELHVARGLLLPARRWWPTTPPRS